MLENQNHINYKELCIRYFSGEATSEEMAQLESWVQKDKSNKKQFREFKKTWQIANSHELHFDAQNAWKNINANLLETDEKAEDYPMPRKTGNKTAFYRIAAAAVIFLSVGFMLYTMFFQNRTSTLMAADGIIEEVLEDGSKVTLNKHSQLTYDTKFNKKDRKVKLTGSAFFDVASNPTKPFLIETSEIQIEVLGTSFYVSAPSDALSSEVIVNSGVVSVSSGDAVLVKLEAGEKVIFNKISGEFQKQQNWDINFLSWKTRKLVFENSRLAEVIATLEKTYGVNIKFANSAIIDCRLTATYEDYPLEDVLLLISETLNLSISGSGKQFIINGEECN